MNYPVDHMLGSRRNGPNHVSMNLGDFDRATGPVRGTDYPTYSDALLDWYKARHVKMVRFLFTWEALQATSGGPVPSAGQGYADYWRDLTGVLARLLARGFYVVLAAWQYNTASRDTDMVYDDAPFTAAQIADFWGKFATAINVATGNDQRVAFDLINEPHTHAESGNRAGDIGISLADWFVCAQAAIDSIRAAGATNTIFVPGMAYTAASSFTTNGSAAAWLTLQDPLKNIAVTVHCYTGLGSADPKVLSTTCSALVTWARTNDIKVVVGEIALDAGANGNPPFCGDLATAQAQWADWHQFCIANNDVLVGWTWWGNSASGWWDHGDSCNGFHWGLTLDDGVTQTIYMDLIEGTLPTPIQPDGRKIETAILFYNAATGDGATATLDAAGNYAFVGAIPGLAKGWTHIAGTGGGGLLFYNALTGEGATATLDAAGNYAFVGPLAGFATGWTHIVGV